ncbi:helix-turn-helix domain-containing protein [Hymenobacter profundi]|uniref:XRE family transcriptional regulator n=1 Tax=Hymenobacter profundi TaxID=1982110 RepID=A0ABS6WUN1_9BACT|nr:XRE family transcriptional regulator [Hymenobacter profundi]MBW3127204.1 XRE family transcriptional regulator [Hymenobacter profundi]
MINFPDRLRSARKAKGWSLQELAEQVGNISKQALGKYEQGLMKPEVDTLFGLTKALGVKPDYFLKPARVDLGAISFRKKASLKVKERAVLEEQIRDYLDRYLEIEELLQIQHEFVNPLGRANKVSSYEEVEQAAYSLLTKWKLGVNPIPNVIETLEDNGICVFVLDAPASFDGLATWVGKLPVVVLNGTNTVDRRRFTALHELAHLLLQINAADDKEEEKFCHRFANAMLLPKEVALRELGEVRTSISYGELLSIKKQYGISVQAIMRRAFDLGIIKDSYYRYFCIKIAPNRKEEGFSRFTFEGETMKSYRFEQLLFRLVAESIVTESKAAALGGMSVSALREKIDPVLA